MKEYGWLTEMEMRSAYASMPWHIWGWAKKQHLDIARDMLVDESVGMVVHWLGDIE